MTLITDEQNKGAATHAAATVSGISSVPVSIASSDTELAVTVKQVVTDEVLSQAKDYTNKILVYLLVALGGGVAASVWNLNGQIYQAVGATGVSSKALELEIARLKDELKKNSQQSMLKECLENRKVIDKAGCYRGS